jgi:orotate phosphoribosyltransferase
MTRDELIGRIKETAYLEGDFLLRSGRRSNYYFDKYRFETQPDILKQLGKLFAGHVTPQTTRIAGAELGGVSLAAAASMESGVPFVIVRNARKEYGTGNAFEGVIDAGDRVLIVEDIATTGGQVLEAAKQIVQLGAKVVAIVAVIDRLEGARENIESAGFRFESLMTTADLGINSN